MKNYIYELYCLLVLFCIVGCTDHNKGEALKEYQLSLKNGTEINKFVDAIVTRPAKQSGTIDSQNGDDVISFVRRDGKTYKCVAKQREIKQYFNEIVTFNPNNGVLFPGAILKSGTLDGNVVSPVNVARRPGTVTISNIHFLDSTRSYSAQLQNVEFDEFNDSLATNFLNRIPLGAQVARISYNKAEGYSLAQSFMELGLSAKWANNSIKAGLAKHFESERTRIVVRLDQSYFDISFAPNPEKGADTSITAASFIRPDVSVTAFKKALGDPKDNPPVYVKSITYGRIFVLVFESSSSMSDLKASIDAAFSGYGGKLETKLTAGQTEILKNSEITMLALGSAAEPVLKVVTDNKLSELNNYLTAGANYSKKSPGWPISYVTRYLKNDDVCQLIDFNHYSIPRCTEHPMPIKKLRIDFLGIRDDKDSNEPIDFTVIKGATIVGQNLNVDNGVAWPSGTNHGVDIAIDGRADNIDRTTLKIIVDKSNANGGGNGQGAGFEWNTLVITATLADGSQEIWYNITNGWKIGNGQSKRFEIGL